MKMTVKEMIFAALFASLTAAGAKINILLPGIPVTLQTLIVMTAGCLIGKKPALISQIVYIAIGLLGVPVFAKPIAGPAYIFQPTFGYLIGFAIGAYFIGYIIEKSKRKTPFFFFLANISGLIIIYLFGTIYLYGLSNLYLGSSMGFLKALSAGALPFILKDMILGIPVALVSYEVHRRTNGLIKGTI
jgi:biotin transport system substrate-specific component